LSRLIFGKRKPGIFTNLTILKNNIIKKRPLRKGRFLAAGFSPSEKIVNDYP